MNLTFETRFLKLQMAFNGADHCGTAGEEASGARSCRWSFSDNLSTVSRIATFSWTSTRRARTQPLRVNCHAAQDPRPLGRTRSSLLGPVATSRAGKREVASYNGEVSRVAQMATGVPGLALSPGYLKVDRQKQLLATVDAEPWRDDLRRRVQHYGYRYDYRRRSVGPDSYLGPLPRWAQEIAERLVDDTPIERTPDQLIVNEYMPGQGISAHIDCVPCFGPVVLSISLGSACVMTFAEPATGESVHVLVEPGVLLVMSGDARYRWRHSIAPRSSDVLGGRRIERQRRVSLTFRCVVPSGGRAQLSEGDQAG